MTGCGDVIVVGLLTITFLARVKKTTERLSPIFPASDSAMAGVPASIPNIDASASTVVCRFMLVPPLDS
jgi:hypothetical protein